MSVVELVKTACREQMAEIAQRIEGDLKAECPKRTGRAAASIETKQTGETSYRIGAEADFSDYSNGGTHLYYADQGNSGSGHIIRSTRPVDRRGRPPGKLKIMNGMHMQYATYVRSYEGKHFIKKVADKYR